MPSEAGEFPGVSQRTRFAYGHGPAHGAIFRCKVSLSLNYNDTEMVCTLFCNCDVKAMLASKGHTLCHRHRLSPRRSLLKPQTKEWTDDSTQEGVDFASGYPVLPHYLALRTQNTSWGRLCVAHSCAGLITIPAKVMSIGGNGWWTGFVCSPRCSQSMSAPTP